MKDLTIGIDIERIAWNGWLAGACEPKLIFFIGGQWLQSINHQDRITVAWLHIHRSGGSWRGVG